MSEVRLLAFGCHECRDEKQLCRQYIAAVFAIPGIDWREVIVPETIRCGWCRRVFPFYLAGERPTTKCASSPAAPHTSGQGKIA